MKDWLDLNGKAVIVTGGSSGIGKAIVQELLLNNAFVVVADLHELSDDLKEELKKEKLLFVKTNISDRKNVQQMIKKTIEKFEKIDVLINNAGINLPRLLVDSKSGQYELNDESFDLMMDVNVKGAYLCTQAAVREMIQKNEGVIINVSSESGLEGSEGQSAYAATKAALNSFTRSWSKELGKHGIRVVGVAPGILEKTNLRTPAYEEALAYTRNISVEQLRHGYTNNSIPIGREGKLSEVADFVSFLISKRASYITGVTYNIAGGKSRG